MFVTAIVNNRTPCTHVSNDTFVERCITVRETTIPMPRRDWTLLNTIFSHKNVLLLFFDRKLNNDKIQYIKSPKPSKLDLSQSTGYCDTCYASVVELV